MTAYIIGNVQIHDPETYATYRAQVPAVVEKFGGRFIVRGGAVETLEGEPGLHRVVVIEFPDAAAARAFHGSPDYAPLIKLRQSASTGALAVVEGV